MNYTAEILNKIENRPGTWNSLRIGVFADGTQIGEYTRNYHNFYRTFYAFSSEGKDYALYSADYTCTRLMELPSCRDIGGEASGAWGFCPVEFFVPTYCDSVYADLDHPIRLNNPTDAELAGKNTAISRTPVLFYPFGFVAGCIWGDDSSWKIQYLDLSRAAEGIVTREERFGYIELPGALHLRDAIDMDGYEDRAPYITFSLAKTFHGETGALVD